MTAGASASCPVGDPYAYGLCRRAGARVLVAEGSPLRRRRFRRSQRLSRHAAIDAESLAPPVPVISFSRDAAGLQGANRDARTV